MHARHEIKKWTACGMYEWRVQVHTWPCAGLQERWDGARRGRSVGSCMGRRGGERGGIGWVSLYSCRRHDTLIFDSMYMYICGRRWRAGEDEGGGMKGKRDFLSCPVRNRLTSLAVPTAPAVPLRLWPAAQRRVWYSSRLFAPIVSGAIRCCVTHHSGYCVLAHTSITQDGGPRLLPQPSITCISAVLQPRARSWSCRLEHLLRWPCICVWFGSCCATA
ncbi:hypothetical protein EJ04DRAFT_77268 [Polyplosphaeria fusca]|uniref:Uncharacterized protein n=1 Tax=Polyplosphaeria fusca TaxID=682080 RepID=A0A9P4QQS0_9PLEO|nr:hypothetical protein EJ04DRAFT_77268 [Polyplosphaeria fusca]